MRTIVAVALIASISLMASALPTFIDSAIHDAEHIVDGECGIKDIYECVKALEPAVVSCTAAVVEKGLNWDLDETCLRDADRDLRQVPSKCHGCISKLGTKSGHAGAKKTSAKKTSAKKTETKKTPAKKASATKKSKTKKKQSHS